MLLRPTQDNKKQKTNNERIRYPAKFPGLGEALIFFSFPFPRIKARKGKIPPKMRETLTTKKPGTHWKNPAAHPAFFSFCF